MYKGHNNRQAAAISDFISSLKKNKGLITKDHFKNLSDAGVSGGWLKSLRDKFLKPASSSDDTHPADELKSITAKVTTLERQINIQAKELVAHKGAFRDLFVMFLAYLAETEDMSSKDRKNIERLISELEQTM